MIEHNTAEVSHHSAPVRSAPLLSSTPAVEAKNVTVAFRSYKKRPTSLKESVIKFIRTGSTSAYSTFNALDHVSFSVPKGKVLGIIGSNGSGKSTLLKVLAQVLKPTEGDITINGRIASLIELGVGFDHELNAIENIYLHGSLHRKSRKQIRERVNHILEFAELTEFAETPIKYYSAGMAARLGFSAAIDIDPDILLVDEVLAVGDARFQEKCGKVFQDFIAAGKTTIMVSHDMGMLQNTAHEIALMSRGKLIYLGDPKKAVELYNSESYQTALNGPR